MPLISRLLGGEVARGKPGGSVRVRILVERDGGALLGGLPSEFEVWMSHRDRVVSLPPGFAVTARSESGMIAGFESPNSRISAVQFLPESAQAPGGTDLLSNFLFGICRCEKTWDLGEGIEATVDAMKDAVGDGRVVCGLSGGVDSTVAAVLASKALGDRLDCIFVNNGLLRLNEAEQVLEPYRGSLGLRVHCVDASDDFISALKGVTDPEAKRKAIGETFIRVFERKAREIGGASWLLQGTIYPDVVESGPRGRGGATVKSHHNVGGLPQDMDFQLLEPLRDLFKDEVRRVGALLGVPKEILGRHPFPGPGLAVRCLGEVTRERLHTLRRSDDLFVVRCGGVTDDARTYGEGVVRRAVESPDGMTADWVKLPAHLLDRVSRRICDELGGVNRVVYDITGKPPATIEWE